MELRKCAKCGKEYHIGRLILTEIGNESVRLCTVTCYSEYCAVYNDWQRREVEAIKKWLKEKKE